MAHFLELISSARLAVRSGVVGGRGEKRGRAGQAFAGLSGLNRHPKPSISASLPETPAAALRSAAKSPRRGRRNKQSRPLPSSFYGKEEAGRCGIQRRRRAGEGTRGGCQCRQGRRSAKSRRLSAPELCVRTPRSERPSPEKCVTR